MENLKLDSFLSYRFLSSLKTSPLNKTAAYVLHSSNLEDNCYDSVIYTMDVLSGKSRQLTAMDKEKQFFWLNEDTIIFPSLRKEADRKTIKNGEPLTVLYKISISGGEAQEYLRLPYFLENLEFIDGEDFLFTASYSQATDSLKDLSKEEKSQALKSLEEEQDYEVLDEIPFWFNAGGFTNKKRSRLYRWESKSQKAIPLTDPLTNVESLFVEKGKALFISSSFENKQNLTNALSLYDSQLSNITPIVEDGALSISFARFRSGGILFAGSDMKSYGVNENPVLYFYEKGSYQILLSPDLSLHNSVGSDCRLGGGFSIAQEGESIYFISTEGHSSYIKRLDSSNRFTTLTQSNGSIDAIEWSDQGLLFIGLREGKLQEIYRLQENQEIALTSFNSSITDQFTLSQSKHFTFPSRNWILDGFVIEPVNYNPNKSYPAILDIHGGPKTVYGSVFYHEMQLWANMGYFVFYCNPQGSDGGGNDFADVRGKYGFEDYEDLMEFTDQVLKRYPQIDTKRLGVTGGSYGGFMTNWIIGQTGRFACAASQRSISNWISKFGTTDIGYYFVTDQQGSTPWSDMENLWLHSPMRYADKAKTPTLFIHSEEDFRCWLAEGLQMFTSLKYHGVEARFCMFRGENHELSRSGKPKHRIRRLQEITQWFEKYLKEK